MSKDHWQRVKEIFNQVAEVAEEQRSALLDELCADDLALKREVKSLLDHDHKETAAFSPDVLMKFGADEKLGVFRIVRSIGEGGMGEVFEGARDDGQFEQRVAIKTLHHAVRGSDRVRRFLHERQIMAGLNHPNIARLLDGGVSESGQPYIVMEYIEGHSITEYADSRRLTVKQRVKLFLQLCDAVNYSHQHLIIHRDLKPSNTLVNDEGCVKLLDFGIAKLVEGESAGAIGVSVIKTETGKQVLTLQYASPEQYHGEPISTASDVYQLGLILYELLAGEPPYDLKGKNWTEIDRLIASVDSPKPSVKMGTCLSSETGSDFAAKRGTTPQRLLREIEGDLDTIILKALRKEPARRYSSVDSLHQDLTAFLSGMPVSARSESLTYRSRKFIKRHKLGVGAGAAILVLLVSLSVMSLRFAWATQKQSEQVADERDRANQIAEFLTEIFENADPYNQEGASLSAREMLDRSVVRLQGRFEDQPDLKIDMSSLVSSLYVGLGDSEKARKYLEQSQSLLDQVASDDEAIIGVYIQMAGTATRLGDFKGAFSLLERASSVLQTRPVGPRLVHCYFAYGLAYMADHQHAKALESLTKAESLSHLLGDKRDPFLAKLWNTFANVYHGMEDYPSSIPYVEKTYAMDVALYGEDHPLTVEALADLGVTLAGSGDNAGALKKFEEFEEKWRQLFGPQHPNLAIINNNKAFVLLELDRPEEAIAAFEVSLELRRDIFGNENLNTLYGLINICYGLTKTGKNQEALPLMQEAEEMGLKVMGPDHFSMGTLYNNYCALLLNLDDLEGALQKGEKALVIYRAANSDPGIAPTQSLLGRALVKASRFEEARPRLEECLAAALRIDNPSVMPWGNSAANLSQVESQQGNLDKAESLILEAFEYDLKHFDIHHRYIEHIRLAIETFERMGGSSNALSEIADKIKEAQENTSP